VLLLLLLLVLVLVLLLPVETKPDRRAWAAEPAASAKSFANRNLSATSPDEMEEGAVVATALSIVAAVQTRHCRLLAFLFATPMLGVVLAWQMTTAKVGRSRLWW